MYEGNFITQLEHSSYYELCMLQTHKRSFSFHLFSFFGGGSGMNGDERNDTK
jgi:hypothetical protein